MSPPETADLLDPFFGLHGCSAESDAQLAHEAPPSRGERERTEETNTAVCVNAVAESSAISLPIVTNKLGHSAPLRFYLTAHSVDCISLQPDNQQDNSGSRVDHSAPGEQTGVTFELHHTSSENIL